ncbi:universal stress protein [Streptomyces mesophilus]|uniref:universal stress protein n=1 Tax=Streptomyces mesophilus TaxID=1775132 RepID=UPI00331700F0
MERAIVVGVDGTTESLAAAEWAAREAELRHVPLRLVHVRQPSRYVPSSEAASAAGRHMSRTILRAAEDRIHAVCPHLPMTDVQLEGAPSAELVRMADTSEFLVLGSRGLSGLTGFFAGSVALAAVAHAERPVVLVRPQLDAGDGPAEGPAGAAQGQSAPREVVVALDIAAPCDEVIEFAFEAARPRAARLRAVHAWNEVSGTTLDPSGTSRRKAPQTEAEWSAFLAAVLRPWRDKYPEVTVVPSVGHGRRAGLVLQAAESAELLVVGRRLRAHPGIGPYTGPVAHAAVHHARCPVAVVPHV